MSRVNVFHLIILTISLSGKCSAFSPLQPQDVYTSRCRQSTSTLLMMEEKGSDRRKFIETALLTTALSGFIGVPTGNAVERAVGAAEKSCREQGNCLEKGDWDGAVGWNWGGRDRCDATDPRCGPDGKLREEVPKGENVPTAVDNYGNTLKITNIAQIDLVIGKAEKGTLKLGLYGEVCPESVSQLVSFLSDGIVTSSKLMLEDGFGVSTGPVALGYGGILGTIYPQNRLDFGIASQGFAYAKTYGMNKIPADFLAQPRPNNDSIAEEKTVRSHDRAGLLSIPKNGLGYGGSGLENDDEAYASCFQISGGNVPSMDKEGRKVIGQVMDESSMEFLARLTNLPTKKGLKGIIPGQNAGPSLLKISITSVSVAKVDE